ncbi:acyl-CoA desaturase [soil metagenome]
MTITTLPPPPLGAPSVDPISVNAAPPELGPLPQTTSGRVITALVLSIPALCGVIAFAGLVAGVFPSLTTMLMAVVLYVVTGFGVTAGFHRLFTHRGFTASRPLRIALAVAGSAAMQGSLESWVANHRLHHRRADQPGDPHSPWAPSHADGRRSPRRTWKGARHSHIGWLFTSPAAPVERYAADIRRDPDLHTISRAFPLIVVAGFALPFVLGWVLGGTIVAGLWAAVWAGGVRILALQHVTSMINSVCHLWGSKPFESEDESRNVAWLAVPSFGESHHNAHHHSPSLARHGRLPGDLDPTAWLISRFERLGWATSVRWPTPEGRSEVPRER